MELLREIAALAKEQGASTAAWVTLVAAIAWVAGAGARGAIRNVRSLLSMNEQLRESMAKQLRESEQARADVERVNHELRGELEVVRHRFTELEARMAQADRLTLSLTRQLRMLSDENARLRTLPGAIALVDVALPTD